MKTIKLTEKQQKLGKMARLMDEGYDSKTIANAINEPVETVEKLTDWIRKERLNLNDR